MTTVDTPAELTRLITEFFGAVSFQTGAKPPYGNLHDLFIDDRQRLVDTGELTSFQETESADRTEIFGNVAHRLSTYEKRGTQNGVAFEGRGVIVTQFIRTPNGWKMTSMAWDDERPGLVTPDRYRA
jgi:hypothetical protein